MAIKSDSKSVTISFPDSKTEVTILNFGATIISWKVNGEEKLFLSEDAKLDGSKAVRGGIPLVFPRFGPSSGNHPATDKLPQHGFARNSTWEFLGEVDPTTAQFALGPELISAEAREQWKFDFSLIYTVKLVDTDKLEISMDVENTGKEAFDFNVLFHSYYRVPEVSKVAVDGLENLVFYNKVKDADEQNANKAVTIDGEVDRVYKASPQTAVINYDSKPYFTVTSNGALTDTVVWNPWKTVENMADFGPKNGYQNMICVENGNVAKFTSLAAHNKWNGTVNITAH